MNISLLELNLKNIRLLELNLMNISLLELNLMNIGLSELNLMNISLLELNLMYINIIKVDELKDQKLFSYHLKHAKYPTVQFMDIELCILSKKYIAINEVHHLEEDFSLHVFLVLVF